jgi:hypothetical protein
MLKHPITNIKKLVIGCIFFSLVLNISNVVCIAETDELYPDLLIYDIQAPSNMIEGENYELIIQIQNLGDKNISTGENIKIGLYLDYTTLVSINNTDIGLSIDKTRYINLSWTPDIGDEKYHTLSVIVNYDYSIAESDYSNNYWDFPVFFPEKNTDLEIIDVDIPDVLEVNQTVNILTILKNYGKVTSKPIQIKFNTSADGEVETSWYNNSIIRDAEHVFSFNWTPSIYGSQKISFDVIYDNKTHYLWEKSYIVGVEQLQWWDENWHYRHFLTTTGFGIISVSFNFTEVLSDLGVTGQSFENETIRILKYDNTGKVVLEITNYRFIENNEYNPVTNAEGELLWITGGSQQENYYCVYFDVEINTGIRTVYAENNDLEESGDVVVNYHGFIDGWKSTITKPSFDGYSLLNEPVDIAVGTEAKAWNVSAFIFMKNNKSYNFIVYLLDDGKKLNWSFEDFIFDREGNWTININSSDKAGYYSPQVNLDFYIGKPDFKVIDISFTTDNPASSPTIYQNDTVNITTHVISFNATVNKVDVTLLITDVTYNELFNETITKNLTKDKKMSISYSWVAKQTGLFDFTVTVDPSNLFDEINETNNILTKEKRVYEWPDLEVRKINLTKLVFNELDTVQVDVYVFNNAGSDAKDYEIVLYVEPDSNGYMKYKNEKQRLFIDVKADSGGTVSMFWDSAAPGKWLIGVKILVNNTKKDSDISNNRLLFNDFLEVKAIEGSKPKITIDSITPEKPEQGDYVDITAVVTDETGLKTVTINITDPNNDSLKADMIRLKNDKFRYVYKNTDYIGDYSFEIEAVDNTIKHNTRKLKEEFTVVKENTFPKVSFVGVFPYVQLVDEPLSITCIATDNRGVESVTVFIYPPDGFMIEADLDDTQTNKYVYKNIYNVSGKYKYKISIVDTSDNEIITEEKYFWITTNIDDTDNDGIPNQWEEKYGLNPEDPADAEKDMDNDSISNLKEYESGTNPRKNIPLENIGYRIKNNIWYILGITLIFIVIIATIIIIKWRKKYELV